MRLTPRFMGLICLVMLLSSTQQVATFAQGRRSADRDKGEDISLTTKDGVQLKATFYASSMGREAVPIVMLHDQKESRALFSGLARVLHSPPAESGLPSHSVLTVDLRGHGGSTTQSNNYGQTRELEAAKLGKQDFINMVRFDMEEVRKFLVKKNDEGVLNLNKLCLLGCGMGANVATNWAAVDWSAPPLASRKQGQDVKGLILVSPDWGFRGIPMLTPLKHPGVREKLSVLIIYGEEDRQAAKSAETINKNLERYHPTPPPEQRREKQDLFLVGLNTSLNGTRLVADPSFNMLPIIEQFLNNRLSKQDFEWIARREEE